MPEARRDPTCGRVRLEAVAFLAMAVIWVAAPAPVQAATEPVEQSTQLPLRCPVMPERFADGKYSYVYDRRTYYFCCADCLEDFKENPKQYIRASSEELAREGSGLLQRVGGPYAIVLLGGIGSAVLLVLGARLRRRRPGLIPGLTYLAWLPFAGALVAQFWLERRQIDHLQHQRAIELAQEQFNYAVAHDFGFPPLPAKPPIAPRLRGTYYRGNDERSAQLWNNGNYRTSTFELGLRQKSGAAVDHGSVLPRGELRLQLDFVRAPFTADEFWGPEVMDTIFLSRQADPIDHPGLARDRVRLTVAEPRQRFSAVYPIGDIKGKGTERLSGVVYVCEAVSAGPITGARYHLAIQYRITVQDGVVQPDSDLWMGALYRTRRVPAWRLPLSEWFSHEPIPELPGPHKTHDATALGISDYQQKIEQGHPPAPANKPDAAGRK